MKIKGFEQLQKKLQHLEKNGARRVLTKAMRAGIKPVLRALREEVPVDHGVVKRTMTSKIGGRGLRRFGIAGADAGKLEDLAKLDEASPDKRPSNIDYLLNDGHINRDGSFTPATRFRDRAEARSIPEAADAFIAKANEELLKEAGRTS